MTRNLLSRTKTANGQPSTAGFANDPSGIESGDIALRDMPRLSTETQRRNGYVQSRAADRGTRIVEDMRNGNYTCSVCTDTVASENSREYSVWHCRVCYNVFHLECIKTWAATNGARSLTGRWKCPFCSHMQDGHPEASCWCGKERFNIHNMENPNACLNTCGRHSQCPHGYPAERCQKTCHPGPCSPSCKANCPKPAAHVAAGSGPNGPKQPSSWKRCRERFSRRTPGTVSALIACFVVLAVIYAFIAVLTSFHIRWWTQPYRFPRFLEQFSEAEGFALILGGLIVTVAVFLLLMAFFTGFAILVNDSLNLNSRVSRPGHKFATQIFGVVFMLVLSAGIIALPIIGLAAGPDIAWYQQMRDSCAGYDTRIKLDEWDTESGSLNRVAQNFAIRSLSNSNPNSNSNCIFYLAPHLQPAYHSAAPFQHYYRLSGSAYSTPHMAIDVDLENRLWRAFHLNNVDEANKFLARQHEKGSRKVPPFKAISESRTANGTFSEVSSTHRHMDIPELDFRIANMHDFIDACEQEPFLRIYSTKRKSADEKRTIGEKMWSNENDEDIVMRTASFGHGRQRLDMCVREVPGGSKSDGTPVSYVTDDLYVPMAIITAHRLRLWEQRSRSFSC